MNTPTETSSTFGRPDHETARVVQEVLYLFNQGQRDKALELAQEHKVPFEVIERVLLRHGPRRKHF